MIGWYAAEVRNHRLSVFHLIKQGLEIFDPKVKTVGIVRGRKVERERQYIPGYVFVRFDVDGQAWRFINGTIGVKRLISAGEEPIRIRDDTMDVLIGRCSGGYVSDAEELDRELMMIRKGDQVRVLDGPFSGFPAIATRKQVGEKVWLAISIFGRDTAAEMPRKSVEIAARASGPSI